MTPRESAIITAYTGICCGPISAFHQYAEEIMGRPLFTHEFADKQVFEKIKDLSKGDFIDLCESVGED